MDIIFHFGLRRCGNHAMIEWIAHHFSGLTALVSSLQVAPPRRFKVLEYFNTPEDYDRDLYRLKEDGGAVFKKDATLANYEDVYKSKYPDFSALMDSLMDPSKYGEPWGDCKKVKFIATIRDFYNNAASRIQATERRGKPEAITWGWNESFPDWWISCALDHLNPDPRCVYARYNTWFTGEDRDRIRHELGLPMEGAAKADDYTRRTVALKYVGMGSSFTGRKMDGRAAEMDVLHRYESFIDHPIMREQLKNDRIRDLNYELFGWTLTPNGKRVE